MIPLFPLGSEGDISIPIPSLHSHAFHLQTPRLLLFPIISEALSFKRAHSTIQSCAACRWVCFDALPVVGFISLTLLVTWRLQERGGRGYQEEGLEMNSMHIRAMSAAMIRLRGYYDLYRAWSPVSCAISTSRHSVSATDQSVGALPVS